MAGESLLENRTVQLAAVLAVGGVLAWLMFRRFRAWSGEAIAQPIADAIVELTHDPTRPAGAVVLPDGRRIPLAQLSVRFDAFDRAVFSFEGVTYQVTGRRPDNDYDSRRLSL